MRWEDCEFVEIMPGKVGGVPLLKGTRMPVQGVIDNFDDGLTPDEIAEVFDLDLGAVRDVLVYCGWIEAPPQSDRCHEAARRHRPN
jgi:uncharacterized protein (DUF433 family)